MSDYSELDPGFAVEGMAMFIYNVVAVAGDGRPEEVRGEVQRDSGTRRNNDCTASADHLRRTEDKAFEILRELPNVPCPPAQPRRARSDSCRRVSS